MEIYHQQSLLGTKGSRVDRGKVEIRRVVRQECVLSPMYIIQHLL